MKTVIFDLDGTLANTSGDLIAAANRYFSALGHDDMLDMVRDQDTAVCGVRAMLKLGYDRLGVADASAQIADHFPDVVKHYAANIDTHTYLYDGAIDAVQQLRGAGIKVGICTNKPAYLAQELLTRLEIRDLFDSLVGVGTLPVSKPDPAPYIHAVELAGGAVARSLLIGDTVTDHDTARAVGVASVLVGFGPAGQSVEKLKPDAMLDHYDDLFDLVAKILP